MNRIFDFQREDPGEVVSRIAMAVHKAVDDNFPQVANASQKFSKTAFAAEDTALNQYVRPSDPLPQRVSEQPGHTQAAISATPADIDVTKPAAKVEPPPDISVAPLMSEFGDLQYSKVEKTALHAKKSGVFRRLLLVAFATTILTAVAAYWVHALLVGPAP